MDPLKLRYVSEVFHILVTRNPDRLQAGIDRRAEMIEQVKKGQEPTGYRAQWLRQSASRVVQLLGNIAREFNEQYPDDKCSAQDLMDVLATTVSWFKKNGQKK